MIEVDQILEELAVTYEQLSIFYDWNEQFSTFNFNTTRISQALSRLLAASKSETALLVSLVRGCSQKLIASSCASYEDEQKALELFSGLVKIVEPRFAYDFTINEEIRTEKGFRYLILIPWKHEEEVLGVFVFSRTGAPYSHQENILLGNICTEFGIMMKNKSLSNSLRQRNLEIGDLLAKTVENFAYLIKSCEEMQTPSDKVLHVKACLEETYLKHLLALGAVLESIHPLQAQRTENIRTICRIVGSQLGYDEAKLQELDLAARLCDISFKNLSAENYESYMANGTMNLNMAILEEIRLHPERSAEIVKPVKSLGNVSYIIACHHEYFDGTGYPEGLEGDQIPEPALIMSLAHHLAHRSEHHFKSVLDLLDLPEERRWLAKKSGKMFSPKIVKALFDGIGFEPLTE